MVNQRLKDMQDSEIDFSDIPEANEEWFKKAKLKKMTANDNHENWRVAIVYGGIILIGLLILYDWVFLG